MKRKRTAGELVAAAVTCGALSQWMSLADDDAFRSTLVMMPLAVATFAALERHAPSGRRGGDSERLFAGATLFGLILLTLGRHSLGLAATDWFLAGGYLLLLVHRVARLLLLWRPALGPPGGGQLSGRPERPAMAFFLLPLTVYLLLQPWQAEHRPPDGDEPFYLLLAHSLAYDFDADLGNNYAQEDWRSYLDRPIEPQPGDPLGPAGQVYSRHNVLLPVVSAPAYRLAGRRGVMTMMALFSAALAWFVLRAALRVARPGAALSAYAVLAFSPPLLIYSYQVWIEVPAALLVLVAYDTAKTLERDAGPGRLAALALALTALPLLKLRLGLLALPLAAYAVYRLRPSRRTLLGQGAVVCAVGVALALHNQLRYGNFLKIHSWSELNVFSPSPSDFARGAVGMFYDVAFGLFPSSPIWALLLPALWYLVRSVNRHLAGELAIVTLPYLVTLSPRFEWYGGWSPPFRYGLVFLPFIALVLAPLFELRRRPGLRWLVVVLGTLTLILTLVWVVVPGWTYNFADGRTLLLDAAATRLESDLARLFPSTVRPRPATWTWPVLSLLLIPAALWRPRRSGVLARRSTTALGFTGLLLLGAGAAVIARHWPTRLIEVEDAWVTKQRGVLFPEPWALERPRYRSGWVIPPRGRVAARVVPGGGRARLKLFVRVVNPDRPVRLRLAAGETVLATADIPSDGWQEIELGPFDWPAGEPMVLHGGGERFTGRAALDRVGWTWE